MTPSTHSTVRKFYGSFDGNVCHFLAGYRRLVVSAEPLKFPVSLDLDAGLPEGQRSFNGRMQYGGKT